jgi:YD repeat-containing protein
LKLLKTPKLIAASAYPSSASSQFGASPTKASRLHTLLAFVFAGLASTVATASVAYNGLDDITKATDFKQVATNYTRDALGNAKAETSPDSGSQSATYDSLGLPQQARVRHQLL